MHIEPELRLHVDPTLFRAALSNIIGNALKYTTARQLPTHRDRSREAPDGRALFVRDNGIGFDMKEHDLLFRPFTRLGNATDFKGTGIGLATARARGRTPWRLDSRGGRCGNGATFFLLLPGSRRGRLAASVSRSESTTPAYPVGTRAVPNNCIERRQRAKLRRCAHVCTKWCSASPSRRAATTSMSTRAMSMAVRMRATSMRPVPMPTRVPTPSGSSWPATRDPTRATIRRPAGGPTTRARNGAMTVDDSLGVPTGFGCRSAKLTTGASTASPSADKAQLMTFASAGVPLSTITTVSYWAYRSSASTGNPAIALALNVSVTGSTVPAASPTSCSSRITRAAATRASWSIPGSTGTRRQRPPGDGLWWTSKIANPTPGSQANPQPWAAFQALYSDAKIHGYGFNLGSVNPNMIVGGDGLVFGTTTTDF